MIISESTKNECEYGEHGKFIAGADEVGRGPLAGPVVVSAVIMPYDFFIDGVDDSKKIKSEKKREALYEEITKNAIEWQVAFVDHNIIDDINILNATRMAFSNAINKLKTRPAHVFVDAINGIDIKLPYTPIVKGDEKVYSIAAASIVAKVTRDRFMNEMDKKYKEYGFIKNKGYGTRAHIEAILNYGPCEIHRQSFLKKILKNEQV